LATESYKKQGPAFLLTPAIWWLPELGSNQRPADYNAFAFGLYHHPRHDPL